MLNELISKRARADIFRGEIKGIHDSNHWFIVSRLGMAIALAEEGDPEVALLFGLYHDCRRFNDGRDPEHGLRAAELVSKHFTEKDLNISMSQFTRLYEACKYHSDGLVSKDVTISSCWDADRLDLVRVGWETDPKLLGTETAKHMALHQKGFFNG